MKLALLPSSLFVGITLATPTSAAFVPFRLTFDALTSSDETVSSEAFFEALSNQGIVSVTNLPSPAREAAVTMAATQHACLMETSTSKQVQTFPDGTIRRTIATQTTAEGGMQKIDISNDHAVCATFEEASVIFRTTAQAAVNSFAQLITKGLKTNEGPLLHSKYDDEAFASFADIVVKGSHLEHFHSYQTSQTLEDQEHDKTTIEVHTDQGLFLAFTPGRWESTGVLSKGFFIQTSDGNLAEVTFNDQDELVFLLGDGVNQYVNDKVMDGAKKLRAVPHSLQLEGDANDARVWYGLMVLPPASALHPAHGDMAFGEIRQGLVAGSTDAVYMACSNNAHDAASSPFRFLAENETSTAAENTTCASAEEVYCWHRCMSPADFNASATACESDNKLLKCVDPLGQVWNGNDEGDFYLGCASSDIENVTAFTVLPDYPRDESLCNNFAEKFYSDAAYGNTLVLDGGNVALFQFTLSGDTLTGRLAFNGILGYLAFGFVGRNPESAMLGGKVIMAMRGNNFTDTDGLDLSSGPVVDEFIISEDDRYFRHWQAPYYDEADLAAGFRRLNKGSFKVDSDECYTALMFEIHDIGGQHFNMSGVDKFMWAANDVDSFMSPHQHKGMFDITWSQYASAGGGGESHERHDDHEGHDDHGDHEGESGNSTANGSSAMYAALSKSALFIAASTLMCLY